MNREPRNICATLAESSFSGRRIDDASIVHQPSKSQRFGHESSIDVIGRRPLRAGDAAKSKEAPDAVRDGCGDLDELRVGWLRRRAKTRLTPLAKTLPPLEGAPDYKGLTDHLWMVKEQFRASKEVILVPEDPVTYETLVQVMDASRERRMQVNGKWVFPQMFPAVTVSSLVK